MANDLVVVKANSLIEASYRLSVDEVRILALTIGTMDPKSNQQIFDFTVADFVREFPEISIDNAYKQIQAAIKRISERWVTTEDEERVTEFRWVSSRTYFKKEGRFRIAMTNEVMPYLTQLKGQFTQYQLRHIAYFNSVHSIRIYELVTQYRNAGSREITVENLKKWLQVENKYPRFNSFNQRVIEPAITEINAKSDLLVSIEQIKRGRTIIALRFEIKPKQAVEKSKNFTKDGLTKLPQRPQVKAGSQAEWDYWKECLRIRKADYDRFKAEDIRRPTKLLEDLAKYYRKTGDTLNAEGVEKALESRKEKGTY